MAGLDREEVGEVGVEGERDVRLGVAGAEVVKAHRLAHAGTDHGSAPDQ
jgi:hypothetical protein